jgi:hypothetical protein
VHRLAAASTPIVDVKLKKPITTKAVELLYIKIKFFQLELLDH